MKTTESKTSMIPKLSKQERKIIAEKARKLLIQQQIAIAQSTRAKEINRRHELLKQDAARMDREFKDAIQNGIEQ